MNLKKLSNRPNLKQTTMSKQIKLTPDPDKQLLSKQLADAIKQQKKLDDTLNAIKNEA